MKVRTHHCLCLGIAIVSIPLIAAAWIAISHLGSFAQWRPWLLLTAWSRLSAEAWNFSLNVGLVGAIMLVALLLWFLEGAIIGVKASTLHGNADWARPGDVKQARLTARWGVVLGRLDRSDKGILRTNDADYSNILVSAPPRSGKGIGVIIPTLLDYPGSFIVYDVKGENYQHTARMRAMKGDRVRVFCPFPMVLENGHRIENRSHGFNPLAVIAANPDLEERVTEIDILATALLSALNARDEGLLSSGREIFKAACAIVCAGKNPSLGRVVDLLTPAPPEEGQIADMQGHFATLAEQAPDPLSRQALIAASANKNENNALYMSVLMDAGLKAWRNPAIRRATETHEFDFDQLRKFPDAITWFYADAAFNLMLKLNFRQLWLYLRAHAL